MIKNSFAPLRIKLLAGFPFFVLALLIILFFYDVVFFGKTFSTSSLLPGTTPNGSYGFSGHRPDLPFSFDTGGNAWVNEPSPYIIRTLFGETSLPAWNPYEGLGIPLVANMNNEIFNPLKLLLNLFPGPFSQDIFFLLRLLVMGSFTYLFLRERKLSPESSLFGSCFFMLSGYSVWWINLHPLSTVMYLPAVFYLYERWSNRRDLRSPFLMSLFLCFACVSGKIPDVIMGLCLLFVYALWKGIMKDSMTGMFREGLKVVLATISGLLMAAFALLPFIELYAHASPFAKALRTGAGGHSIPLAASIALIQPLFLGWGNYFYGSWVQRMPNLILPHAGIVIIMLSLYAVLHKGTLKKTFPFVIFSLFIFFAIYGLIPFCVVSQVPVFRNIEFLKYNAMFFFCLAVISASAFEDLLSGGNKNKFILSLCGVSLVILACCLAAQRESPSGTRQYAAAVLLLSLSGVVLLGLAFRFIKSRKTFGLVVFAFLVLELFLYMPKDHPDRTDPYHKPPYLEIIRAASPFRIIGDGGAIPPLVSNAAGVYDIRSISVLLSGDYYTFFENLLSFSMPGTNNPKALFAGTSPFIDLLGVKYVLSQSPLEYQKLEEETKTQIESLRWIRLFDAMIEHTVKGEASYGFFRSGDDERFSFFFPTSFVLNAKLRVSEPFLFAGFALKDASRNATARVRIAIEDKVAELIIKDGDGWKDEWLDVSGYLGKVITVRIESSGSEGARIAMGDFGLSPGYEEEKDIYNDLLALHKAEFDLLKYMGIHEGMHIYRNENVMDRAFVLHDTKTAQDLGKVIQDLRKGINFRSIALVPPSLNMEISGRGVVGAMEGSKERKDAVTITRYQPDSVAIDVESEGGLLVLSDLYYPGWKVSVNGRESEMVKVFGLLRGVKIGKGKSAVLFSYRPMSLYAGSVLSVMTLIAWFLISRKKTKLR